MLEREGWAVTRSAGSHGPMDLIAMNAAHVMLVQVKSAKTVDGPGTVRILANAIEDLRAVPAPAAQVSRWLFLRAIPGGWLRLRVDDYPADRLATRLTLARDIRRWIDRPSGVSALA